MIFGATYCATKSLHSQVTVWLSLAIIFLFFTPQQSLESLIICLFIEGNNVECSYSDLFHHWEKHTRFFLIGKSVNLLSALKKFENQLQKLSSKTSFWGELQSPTFFRLCFSSAKIQCQLCLVSSLLLLIFIIYYIIFNLLICYIIEIVRGKAPKYNSLCFRMQ